MSVLTLWFCLDHNLPLWINFDGDCEYFESITDAIDSYGARRVSHITLDGEGVLTLELWR